MTFVLIGFGKKVRFPPSILDKRTDRFDIEFEQYWLDVLSRADCVIGTHGSHMQIASGLARFTVELLAEDKLGNFLQPFLVKPDQTDWRLNMFRFRVLYGNRNLSDVTPKRVSQIALSQLENWEIFRRVFGLNYQPRDPVNLVLDTVPFTQEFFTLFKIHWIRKLKVMGIKERYYWPLIDLVKRRQYRLLLDKFKSRVREIFVKYPLSQKTRGS